MKLRKGFKSEANAYAREFRQELGLQLSDPLCAWTLAEHLAIPLMKLSELKNKIPEQHFHYVTKQEQAIFSAITIFKGHRRLIIHNDAHHPRRQASNIAHELSHAILGHPPTAPLNEYGCRHFQKEIEDEANWLASSLLISEEAALHIVKTNMSISEAVRIYKVSHALILMRINVTGARKRINSNQKFIQKKKEYKMQYIEHSVGDLAVTQRQQDGYINASKLTKAYEKQTGKYRNPNSWFEKDRTNEYLELLSDKTGIEVYDLVQKKGAGKNTEVWLHPKLAVSFAMWLSPEFEMMVSEWVEQWLFTGKTPVVEQPIALHPYQRVWYQRLMLFEQNTKLPSGKWCIFEQIGKLMRDLEAKGIPLHDRATVDISIGRAWCHYLREKRNYDTSTLEQYIHHYPDSRGEQPANIYPFDLLGEFHQWLQDTYIPDKFPGYVRKFASEEECQLISSAIGYEVKPITKRLTNSSSSI
jgi:Zn-dependent peptidase ImmA (M78 family)